MQTNPADGPSLANAKVHRLDHGELAALSAELRALRAEIVAPVEAPRSASAQNLLHYLALRRRDLRPLQDRLARLGLSSLGRCEANVLANVDAVLDVVECLQGGPSTARTRTDLALGDGSRLLERHAEELLGPARGDRRVRILVTLPSEAADDPALVRALVSAGMDCARINCAHDDEAVWARMIHHVRAAGGGTRRTRILMDLAGPKLRTGPLLPSTAVHRLRPGRDRTGRVEAPAVAHLVAQGSVAASAADVATRLPVPGDWLARVAPGDQIRCVDARGSRRVLLVTEVGPGAARVECDRTVYVWSGMRLVARRGRQRLGGDAAVGELPADTRAIRLRPGDELELTRSLTPGSAAVVDGRGNVRRPARIGCTLPEVFDQAKVGERVLFDDGRIGGVIRAVGPERLLVEIREARVKGEELGADKGINLPDTRLALAAVTEKDLQDLLFVARHADAVALSFVSGPARPSWASCRRSRRVAPSSASRTCCWRRWRAPAPA
jgi:pyruvate kinase